MDLRKIKKLIDLLEESNLAEIEIKEGEESVRLARVPKGTQVMSAPMQQYAPAPAAPAPAATMPMQSPTEASTGGAKQGAALPEGHVLRAPMEADISGTIVAVLSDTGQPVEFDQPLFVIG